MRTNFTPAQLADPRLAAAERELRACVHCGICTATCPTYTLLGDELDGPRGRIQLIQQMLESGAPPSATVVLHIDRCLSCLACVSACPSGVNYPRLIDEARAHIEKTAKRPLHRRFLRWGLGTALPRRWLLKPLLTLARIAKPVTPLMPAFLRTSVEVAARLPRARVTHHASSYAGESGATKRVALHIGCVQEVIAPRITAAAIRVLTRHGFDVAIVQGTGCCGSLNHHLGQVEAAERHATALLDDIAASEGDKPFDAIVTTASGCGATMRDYAFNTRHEKAAGIAARTRDITDVLRDVPLRAERPKALRVAYHTACSLMHGMKQSQAAPLLLRSLGFTVLEPRDTQCCGSAGVYNVLEPEIAQALQHRKAASLMELKPDLIATGNIGCFAQIAAAVDVPVVHTIELIDWATGGPPPPSVERQ